MSGSTPICLQSNSSLAGMTPVCVLQHSNQSIYVGTQGNDRIYRFASDGSGSGTVIWDTNLSVISNPTALVEDVDGAILVASDGTNSIEKIDMNGSQIGTSSFIRDGFTGLVTQMLWVGGQ